MQEEIKYNKDEKWIPYKQLAGTPQQTIDRLEQENKELKEKIEDKPLQCLFYNNKQNKCALFTKTVAYRSALEKIKEIVKPYLTDCQGSLCEPIDEVRKKINEVLND